MTYLDAAEPALIEASFSAPSGSSVALVGSTGAGKSTLADVVLGVLEPDSGTVTISGVPPREAISRWPGAIAYVPQQVALVFGTVRDNVALGLPAQPSTTTWSGRPSSAPTSPTSSATVARDSRR